MCDGIVVADRLRSMAPRPLTAGAEVDAQLVARARSGERAAFEELVRRHADRLYAVVLGVCGDRQNAEERRTSPPTSTTTCVPTSTPVRARTAASARSASACCARCGAPSRR